MAGDVAQEPDGPRFVAPFFALLCEFEAAKRQLVCLFDVAGQEIRLNAQEERMGNTRWLDRLHDKWEGVSDTSASCIRSSQVGSCHGVEIQNF